MSSHLSERGAVHILFLIMVLVVALAFGALWFVQFQKNEDHENLAREKAAEASAWQEKYYFARDSYQLLAPFAGKNWPDKLTLPEPDARGKFPPVDTHFETAVRYTTSELANLKDRIGDAAATPTDLHDAWTPIINRYQTKVLELRQKDTTIGNMQKEIDGLKTTVASNQTAHDGLLQKLQQDKDSSQARLDAQLTTVRSQNDEVAAQVTKTQADLETAKESHNTERTKLVSEKRDLDAQVRAIHGVARIKREQVVPDGKILAADPGSGMVYVDLGGRHNLRRGTRFKIFETGKGNVKIAKGWLTITDVGPDMSEARISEVNPGVGPIAQGDWLYSPTYDRDDKVAFCFLGQLPGRYTREMAERMLTAKGAVVAKNVTTTTDFVVLGLKEEADGEDLTESPDYKNALRWGIEIIRAEDLIPFINL